MRAAEETGASERLEKELRPLFFFTFTIRSVCQHYSAEKRQEAVSPGDE
jgi:hypothetical protein